MNIFINLKKLTHALFNPCLPFLPLFPGKWLTCFLPLHICLHFLEFHINSIILYVFLHWTWLFLDSLILFFMSVRHLYCWVVFHFRGISQFVYSLGDENLCCFQFRIATKFLKIYLTNKVAINIYTYILVNLCFNFFLVNIKKL